MVCDEVVSPVAGVLGEEGEADAHASDEQDEFGEEDTDESDDEAGSDDASGMFDDSSEAY